MGVTNTKGHLRKGLAHADEAKNQIEWFNIVDHTVRDGMRGKARKREREEKSLKQ